MRRHTRALTLVELLLVVFILAAAAATAVSFVDQQDQQVRYDLDRARLMQLRTAIGGVPSDRYPEAAAGFVADMGRLPLNLRELLVEPVDSNDERLYPYTVTDSGVAGGWRGPYLAAPAAGSTPEPRFPSAFDSGSPEDPNYGWQVEPNPLPTLGPMSVTGPPAADAPSATIAMATAELALPSEAVVVEVTFADPTIASDAEEQAVARVRFPADGDPAAGALTSDLEANRRNGATVTFRFAAGDLIPWGVRAFDLIDESNGTPYDGDENSNTSTNSEGRLVLLRPRTQPIVRLAWSP